jgi:hypothetical protein
VGVVESVQPPDSLDGRVSNPLIVDCIRDGSGLFYTDGGDRSCIAFELSSFPGDSNVLGGIQTLEFFLSFLLILTGVDAEVAGRVTQFSADVVVRVRVVVDVHEGSNDEHAVRPFTGREEQHLG